MGKLYKRNKNLISVAIALISLLSFLVITRNALAATVTVIYQNNVFSPQSINITAGDTVIWSNQSNGYIEIASDQHPQHTNYPPLNLGLVPIGGSAQLVFNQTGNYSYHNHLLPSATGSVAVYPVSGFTLADLRTLLQNYLSPDDHLYNDNLYNPADQKINALDAAYLIYILR